LICQTSRKRLSIRIDSRSRKWWWGIRSSCFEDKNTRCAKPHD